MNVVWHDHISSYNPICCIYPCSQNLTLHLNVGKNGGSSIRTYGNKKDCRAKASFSHGIMRRMLTERQLYGLNCFVNDSQWQLGAAALPAWR